MLKKATLTLVNSAALVRERLPRWTNEDPDDIIAEVSSGHPRVIFRGPQDWCLKCKQEIEAGGAGSVAVE